MPETLKVAVAGLGVVGGAVVNTLRLDPRFEVAAGADLRPQARAQLERDFGARAYEDVRALCAHADFDVLYVCTPEDLHAEHASAGIAAGRHVVVDKPLALTAHDARRVVAEARRANVVFLCGHSHSFDAPIAKMAEIVASGALGPVRMINTWQFNNFMYRPRSLQDLDRSRGGSALYNLGPHQIDIVRRIADQRVQTVRASIGAWDPRRKTDGSYCAFLGLENGAVATMVLNGYGYFDSAELVWWTGDNGGVRPRKTHAVMRSRFEGLGEGGEAALRAGMRYGENGADVAAWSRVEPDPDQAGEGPRQHFFGLTLVSCERGDLRQSPNGVFVHDAEGTREVALGPARSARAHELDGLFDAVVHRRPFFHDGAWGAHTVEILSAMYESSGRGREIVLEPG